MTHESDSHGANVAVVPTMDDHSVPRDRSVVVLFTNGTSEAVSAIAELSVVNERGVQRHRLVSRQTASLEHSVGFAKELAVKNACDTVYVVALGDQAFNALLSVKRAGLEPAQRRIPVRGLA